MHTFSVKYMQAFRFGKDFTQLKVLDIRDSQLNPASLVDQQKLSEILTKTVYIKAGSNKLQLENFAEFPALRELELQNNSITVIQNLYPSSLPHLVSLDLSSNSIDITSLEALSHLSKLKVLNLAYNHLTTFSFCNKYGFQRLQQLNLRGNLIESSGFNHFQIINSLRELNVSENCITEVTGKGSRRLRSLHYLDLSSNLVIDTELISSLADNKSLRLLNVANMPVILQNNQRKLQIEFTKVSNTCHFIWNATEAKEAMASLISWEIRNSPSQTQSVKPRSIYDQQAQKLSAEKNPIRLTEPLKDDRSVTEEKGYKITHQELQKLIAGWRNLPRPDDLNACYEMLTDIVHQPKITVASLVPRPVPINFPAKTKMSVIENRFWAAATRHGELFRKTWMSKGRLALLIRNSGDELSHRKRTARSPQIRNQRSKNELLNSQIKQIDEKVGLELQNYYNHVRKQRKIFEDMEK